MVTFDIHTVKTETYFTLVFRKINIYIQREQVKLVSSNSEYSPLKNFLNQSVFILEAQK